jgi:hypothetical protein
MTAERVRPDGSRLGRPAVDWEHAFAHYASLPAPKRSYRAVADAFGVSVRTVEKHGRTERWRDRIAQINTEAATQTNAALADERVQEVRKIGRLIEASFMSYADKLRRSEVRMTPADLERLYRLSRQLGDELGAPAAPLEAVPSKRRPEDVASVVDALAEAGALDALGLVARAARDTTPYGQGTSMAGAIDDRGESAGKRTAAGRIADEREEGEGAE